jgi:hypothetical protein
MAFMFNLPFIFALFAVAIVVNDAALTPELYWNKVLPGASMPKAIRESLNSEVIKNKGSSAVPQSRPIPIYGKGFVAAETSIKDVYDVPAGKVGRSSSTFIYKRIRYGRIRYGRIKYAATETALKDASKVSLFFLETDLVPEKTFNLQFIRGGSPVSFMPREMADSIPFSSHNLTYILHRFSINPESEKASTMKETITTCEEPGISGEEKYCPTSLESMIDFSTKILGKKNNVRAVSTGSNGDTQIKKYKIEHSVKSLTGDRDVDATSIVCHKMPYVYAVFYCHSIKSTKLYTAPLKSETGSEVEAVAVCHEDTTKWNPEHLSFQMLKVKPGTPICHFLADDTVVWYRN